MLYARIVLGLGVLMFAAFGVALLFRPGILEDFGIVAETPQGRTEIRAFYGGLEIALAGFLLFAMFRPSLAPVACLVLALMSAGPLFGRLVGFGLDASANGTMWMIAAVEAAFTVLGFVGWMRG